MTTKAKARFGTRVSKAHKSDAGRTPASETPLRVQAGGHRIDSALRAHLRQRMDQKLGKYASIIESAVIRFEDVNGPRGGADKSCLVQLSLSSLKPVVVQERAGDLREAFDLALAGAERAARRTLQKHGFSARSASGSTAAAAPEAASTGEGAGTTQDEDAKGSLIGRRAGRARANLLAAAARPEKGNRAAHVDTALPGTSASDRRVGQGHTARRNTKLNVAGMTYGLEDSQQDRPSRKSTRAGAGVKSDSNLRARATQRSLAPTARHAR